MCLPLPESNQLPHNLSAFGTQDGIESHPGSCWAKKEHKIPDLYIKYFERWNCYLWSNMIVHLPNTCCLPLECHTHTTMVYNTDKMISGKEAIPHNRYIQKRNPDNCESPQGWIIGNVLIKYLLGNHKRMIQCLLSMCDWLSFHPYGGGYSYFSMVDTF